MDMDKLTFEQAYAQLVEIVERLESADLTLEEAVTLFEQGQKLAQQCGEMLDSAELRIQQIADDGTLAPPEG
ncbi:MAG: exodeoxyribonuclease VII small subunit [Anaerolineae bacterium]|nr:exodeoxyribonuclease VII small subunit [Anaerolineae bacterium]